MTTPKEQEALPTAQTLEWEVPNAISGTKRSRPTRMLAKFDRAFPSHRTYLGISRTVLLVVVGLIALAVMGLVIGLSVALTRHGSASQNLPLPSSSQSHTGDLTYYGPGLGACGVMSDENDNIVSVSYIIFDAAGTGSNPNANPLCGLKLRAERFDEQVNENRSIDLTVVDRCTGCQSTDLDTSPGAFDKLAARASGRVSVTWAWLSAAATAS